MSNYTVTTNFGDKDSLPAGNSGKIIKGSEFTTEFNNIATMSATKADSASPTITGNTTLQTATITTANTTTANITTANITTANCDNLSVEKATNSGETDLLIHNTGTGDADAVLKLDSSATGESEIDFLHDGSLGATIEYFVDGGSPDLNIKTLTSGSVIDLQPNDVNTLRAAEGVVTVTGDLRISDGSVKGEIAIIDTNDLYIADNTAGIRISGSSANNIYACDENGAITDGVTKLGSSTGRFNTGYFTGLELSKAGTDADCNLNVTATGTGDADARLHLDSADTGEAQVEFANAGTVGADIVWTTQGDDELIVTTKNGTNAPIVLEPNNVETLRVAEEVTTARGVLNITNGTNIKGHITYTGSDLFITDENDCGLRFGGTSVNNILPCDSAGALSNELINLGAGTARFKTIYSKNDLDTSSDRNLKQSIEELSEAEVRVAQACKGLIRKYKWNDSVERKGVDGSRYHVGVIAQDLEAAFEAEGLNAEEYGMFTRNEETGNLSVKYSELLAFIIGGL